MYNQNWHVACWPEETAADISPDTQVTNALEIVFRMDDLPEYAPGPQITVAVYGEYADPNGQHDDGSWPPVVIGTQVCYEVLDENSDSYDADYEHEQGDWAWFPSGDDATQDDEVMAAVKRVASSYVSLGDSCWDWDGKDPVNRTGGPVQDKAH